MNEFDKNWVWDDAAVRAALGWYREVQANRKPAKFRIAATIPIAIPIVGSTEEALWHEFASATAEFLERWQAIRDGSATLPPRTEDPNLLDLCHALCQRMLRHCNFCQWNCGVDRTVAGKLGACKLAAESRVGCHFHHQGEELVYRGRLGSGTIFFTSCNMRCAFCQNGDISTDKDNGEITDSRTLAAMAWLLRMEGCHNINWVGGEPTIHLHSIVDAIRILGNEAESLTRNDLANALATKADPFFAGNLAPARAAYAGAFNVPMLWNSNFFMTEEAMRVLRVLIDVWLPDFKFGPGRCAITLSRTPRYWETVTRNLAFLERWGEDLTIRHLVMPNHVECCTRPILEWLSEVMPKSPVNIMDQYHPDMFTDPSNPRYEARYEELARRPRREEVRRSYEIARALGLPYETVTRERRLLGLSP